MLTWILQLALPNQSVVAIRPKWENNSSTLLKAHTPCVCLRLAGSYALREEWEETVLLMSFYWITSLVARMACYFHSSACFLQLACMLLRSWLPELDSCWLDSWKKSLKKTRLGVVFLQIRAWLVIQLAKRKSQLPLKLEISEFWRSCCLPHLMS